MRGAIKAFCGIKCSESNDRLYWSHSNALDFMAKLYDGANLALTRKRDLYLDWCTWIPSLAGNNHGRGPAMRWTRTHRDAIAPFKERASDSGFDLTLIRVARRFGLMTVYGTGLKIEPDHGWYFDVVPRSSIIKTGHMLANGVGVIDRAYRGEILVPLIKVDPDAGELVLPARVVQLVPRPIVHLQVLEVDDLQDTTRGEGGFGSTGA
jgi:deoxyuridine 5'-triphosphate nucleotidohydrolase